MRNRLVALAALTSALAAAPPALAATVTVRIEGAGRTVFEGPVSTDGHDVRASSDTVARRCDGTSGVAGRRAGPTPTASAADAMRIVGETFDGEWFPDYQDYFITRFGPAADSGSRYWGLLIGGRSSSRGGCGTALDAGASVLWTYDAFAGRPYLRLAAASDPSPAPGPAAPTATATVGQPLALSVTRSTGSATVAPAQGVAVSRVSTDAQGFQTVQGAPLATTTQDGSASITFATAGWHRIKAAGDGFTRSNRLDVCVRGSAGEDCGSPPADTVVRTPPPASDGGSGGSGDDGSPIIGPSPGADGPGTGGGTPTGGARGALRLSRPAVLRSGLARGRVLVRFRVLDAGPGLRSFAIDSREAGRRGTRFVRRASGRGATTARLRLPAGRRYDLRLTATDASGRSSSLRFARVTLPVDDRSRALSFGAGWRRARTSGAWRSTVTRGGRGRTVRTVSAAGRAAFVLRRRGGPAVVEVRAGGRARRVRVGRAETLATSPRLRRRGAAALRVVRGTVDVDGIALLP